MRAIDPDAGILLLITFEVTGRRPDTKGCETPHAWAISACAHNAVGLAVALDRAGDWFRISGISGDRSAAGVAHGQVTQADARRWSRQP